MRNLVTATLLLAFTQFYAQSVAASGLGPDRAIVLIEIDTERWADLTFLSIDSDGFFRINRRRGVNKEVPAGVYYLRSVKMYSGAQPLRFSAPETNLGAIPVAPGTVTYLGYWTLDEEYLISGTSGRKIDYDLATIQKFLDDDPSLANYPLRIATDQNQYMQVDWQQVIDYKSP